MKTILLLMLISLGGFGQINPKMENFLDTTYFLWENTVPIIEGITYTEKSYINAKIDKRIVELWHEFEVECYNDSTLEHTYFKPDMLSLCYCYSISLGSDYSEFCCKIPSHFTYTHKIPTLIEFMQFIERKTKKL